MLNLESIMMSRSDRRSEERRKTAEHVDVFVAGAFISTCRLRDLCASGAFIETTEKLPVGTTVEIHFPLARGSAASQKSLCMQAVVARVTEDGVGVMVTSKSLVSLESRHDTVVI